MTKSNGRYGRQHYRIKIKGRIDKKWAAWFEGMRINYDQAALHGLLIRIRDLNLTLLSLEQIGLDKQAKNEINK